MHSLSTIRSRPICILATVCSAIRPSVRISVRATASHSSTETSMPASSPTGTILPETDMHTAPSLLPQQEEVGTSQSSAESISCSRTSMTATSMRPRQSTGSQSEDSSVPGGIWSLWTASAMCLGLTRSSPTHLLRLTDHVLREQRW